MVMRILVDKHDSVSSLYYIMNQKYATLAVLFVSNCKITLHVSEVHRIHHQEYLTLSDPMSDLVRHYDFPVPLRCHKTSDTFLLHPLRCRSLSDAFPHVVQTLANR